MSWNEENRSAHDIQQYHIRIETKSVFQACMCMYVTVVVPPYFCRSLCIDFSLLAATVAVCVYVSVVVLFICSCCLFSQFVICSQSISNVFIVWYRVSYSCSNIRRLEPNLHRYFFRVCHSRRDFHRENDVNGVFFLL